MNRKSRTAACRSPEQTRPRLLKEYRAPAAAACSHAAAGSTHHARMRSDQEPPPPGGEYGGRVLGIGSTSGERLRVSTKPGQSQSQSAVGAARSLARGNLDVGDGDRR